MLYNKQYNEVVSMSNYCVYSSSPDSCTKRFCGTMEECEQWITDNKHRFPGYVTLKIQPPEESAKWERDFDIHSGGSVYEQMNKIDDAESLNENYGIKNTRKLQESTKYEYEVYMDSNSSDEDEFFTDLRLAKKFAKYLAKRYCPQDPGSYAVIRRGPRGGDPNIQEWPIIAKIKDD